MKRIALIDGDLIVHEISVLGEYYAEEDTEKEKRLYRDFRYLEEIINTRIDEILDAAQCDATPFIYLSGENNFRYDIAKTKPYKGNRKSEKPFHYDNVKWYIISRYNAIIVDGMEADDAMAIHQLRDFYQFYGSKDNLKQVMPLCNTVICSRDKDLDQVPGWHYSWEVGLQPERKLYFVSPLGELNAKWNEGVHKRTGMPTRSLDKLTGSGYLWFCAQVLTGDPTDNIPGLKRCGKAAAFEGLSECESEAAAIGVVKELYKETYGEEYEEALLEQARLVWMVRDLNEDGSPKMWDIPE